MQKHPNIFYIAMMFYGFGILASIAFHPSESPNIAREIALTAAAKTMSEANSTVGQSGFKATTGSEVLITSPTAHREKKI